MELREKKSDDMSKGKQSVFQSIFILALTSIGSGCLALPNKYQYTGIVFSIIILFVSAYVNYITATVLIKVAEDTHIYNYTALVKKFLGKNASWIHFITIFINVFGVSVVYQLISKLTFNFI